MPVSIREGGYVLSDALGPGPGNFLLLLVLQGSDQVDALLNGPHRSYLMVDLHGLQGIILGPLHARLVMNGLVEELTLLWVYELVGLALHDHEVALPAMCQFEMLLSRWERLRLSFLIWHARLRDNLLHVLVGLFGHTFEFFDLRMDTRFDVCDSGQFVG